MQCSDDGSSTRIINTSVFCYIVLSASCSNRQVVEGGREGGRGGGKLGRGRGKEVYIYMYTVNILLSLY